MRIRVVSSAKKKSLDLRFRKHMSLIKKINNRGPRSLWYTNIRSFFARIAPIEFSNSKAFDFSINLNEP